MHKILKFIYSFSATTITAIVASYFSAKAMQTFYPSLTMPPFCPPNFVFAPVWSVLYAFLIISYYIVLNSDDKPKVQNATLLFLGQLFLQMLWSYLFFGIGLYYSALIVMLLMIWTVYKMIETFKSINKFAGNLQYPYLLWLLFATYLNTGIAYLNTN